MTGEAGEIKEKRVRILKAEVKLDASMKLTGSKKNGRKSECTRVKTAANVVGNRQ
jgi:hypothetical protein